MLCACTRVKTEIPKADITKTLSKKNGDFLTRIVLIFSGALKSKSECELRWPVRCNGMMLRIREE